MSLRNPLGRNQRDWGNYASLAACPNGATSTVPANKVTGVLEVGDTAFVSGLGLCFCNDVGTPGGLDAVWMTTMILTAANFDAFGRLRVSNPETIFDSKMVYDDQPLFWSEAATGGATAGVWSATNACVTLSAGASQTNVRQTKRYFNYQPGKSQAIFQTFNLNGGVADCVKRAGYFDATNGLFLELDGVAGVNFVRRSGSSVATQSVPQASWNIDPMDGTGPSGVDLDFATTQILVIDFEWLGVGAVRMGFNVGGATYYAHQFNNANIQTAVYMTTPNLPIRYEIVGGVGMVGKQGIDCICSTVISEGGAQNQGVHYSYVRTTVSAAVASGASAAVLSISPAAATPRVTLKPNGLSVLGTGNANCAFQLVLNGTLTTPLVTTVTQGYAAISETTSVYTQGTGTVIASGLISSTQRAELAELLDSYLTLGATIAGVTDVLSLVITNLSGGNDTYRGAIDWIAIT